MVGEGISGFRIVDSGEILGKVRNGLHEVPLLIWDDSEVGIG